MDEVCISKCIVLDNLELKVYDFMEADNKAALEFVTSRKLEDESS
jgi:hypothetical protein